MKRLVEPDVVGSRGEILFELAITQYKAFRRPLFRSRHLGEKWPTVDFFVEIRGGKKRPFFFVQVKSRTAKATGKFFTVQIKGRDYDRMLKIPAPTYLVGVDEPSKKVYIRSVHAPGVPSLGRIPKKYILNDQNLMRLRDEVVQFWSRPDAKPKASVFL